MGWASIQSSVRIEGGVKYGGRFFGRRRSFSDLEPFLIYFCFFFLFCF